MFVWVPLLNLCWNSVFCYSISWFLYKHVQLLLIRDMSCLYKYKQNSLNINLFLCPLVMQVWKAGYSLFRICSLHNNTSLLGTCVKIKGRESSIWVFAHKEFQQISQRPAFLSYVLTLHRVKLLEWRFLSMVITHLN